MRNTGNFSLKWSEFETNVRDYFGNLRDDQIYCDVTLATDDDHQIQAHKIILSAGSDFFSKILFQMKNQTPVIYLKGVDRIVLENILDFLYNGEANVAQDALDKFLDAALGLQVKGLQSKLDFKLINDLGEEQSTHKAYELKSDETSVRNLHSYNLNDNEKPEETEIKSNELKVDNFVEANGESQVSDETGLPQINPDSNRLRGSNIDWTELQAFENIQTFEASDVFNELETQFSKSRSRENRYGDVSFYRCKYSRKVGFIPCPYKLRVIFPADQSGVVVQGIEGVNNHEHREDPDLVDDGHNYRWSDVMTRVVLEGLQANKRPDRIMKDLAHVNNMAPVTRIMPTKQQLNNKIAATRKFKL